ncbi:MAG TPA: cysteine--tRNA ligase [Thermoplasmata archaeon]|nr:cysteine--tRNA ligase [Thermoplasmata archaeon]
MALQIYNTRSRRKEPFVPREGRRVRMYVCGPTTYDYSHLGHAKSYVSFDTVRRYLEYLGYSVMFVQNFTDIEEVIIRRAAQVGKPPLEYAQFYIDAFLEDMRALNVLPATHYPKVSEHILEIQTLIALLIERGNAYPVNGDVYFRTRNAKRSFGILAHQRFEDVVADPLPPGSLREDPLDFALWKASKEGEPSWPSPWGAGRPGWHVECNAMAFKYLGAPLDIHGGGSDLKFPHHESEAMICEGAWGVEWTRTWMHNGFLTLEQDKMSKSLGNFVTIRSVLAVYPGEVVRLCLLKAHYREDVEYDKDCFRRTREEYEAMRAAIRAASEADGPGTGGKVAPLLEATRTSFLAAMDDDFNTPDAVYRLQQMTEALVELPSVSSDEGRAIVALYRELGGILGLFTDASRGRAPA